MSPDVGNRLAFITTAVLFGFGIASAIFYLCYPLSRARHEAVQAALAERRAPQPG